MFKTAIVATIAASVNAVDIMSEPVEEAEPAVEEMEPVVEEEAPAAEVAP